MSAHRLSRPCLHDINDIFRYTARHRGLDVADAFEASLIDAFERLAQTPGLGHPRSDLTSKPVFFYLVAPYFVIYQRETDPLLILAVLHSARNIKAILRTRPL